MKLEHLMFASSLALAGLVGCGGDDDTNPATGGHSGKGGSAGKSGKGGASGKAGGGGKAGTGGKGGSGSGAKGGTDAGGADAGGTGGDIVLDRGAALAVGAQNLGEPELEKIHFLEI